MRIAMITPLKAALAAAVCVCSFAAAADVTVYVTGNGFNPDPITILAGETVYWACNDANGPYDIGSIHGDWTAGQLVNFGDLVSMQFLTAGTYSYYDSDNANFGTIYVVSNVPPTIAITSPADGAVFTAPAAFPINVNASDTVREVKIYVGAQEVTDSWVPPFRAAATKLGPGTHAVSVTAYDAAGNAAQDSVTVTVQPPVITLTSPRIVAGRFEFDITGLAVGNSYVIQYSTNLSATNWVNLATNREVTSTSVSFTNSISAGRRFFRLIWYEGGIF